MSKLPTPTIEVPEGLELGPAMSRLNERQQKFVMAMLQGNGSMKRAAMLAGYPDNPENPNQIEVTAHRLSHDPKVQEAIREVGLKSMTAASLVAVKTLIEISMDPTAERKDRIKASDSILDRTGLPKTTEHKTIVTHRDETSDEMVKQLTQLAKSFGMDPSKLLGGMVIEAEYIEEDDLGDIYG